MYFLLEQSDFLTQFFDVALADMIQPVEKVPKEKLQVLFDLVLRSHNGAGSESIIESIKVGLDSTSLFEKLLKINSVAGVDIKRYMSEVRSGNVAIEPLLSRHSSKSLNETEAIPMNGILYLINIERY
jgi:gamma-tubulin complex component 2